MRQFGYMSVMPEHAPTTAAQCDAGLARDLTRTLSLLLPRPIGVVCRPIRAEDTSLLTTREHMQLANRQPASLHASASARVAARELLAARGIAAAELLRNGAGAPVWPAGFVGSISHDAAFAAAAIADAAAIACLGIDIEPAIPLHPELLDLVATPREQTVIGTDLGRARVLFSMKEAVYKAVNPLTGRFLEFSEIEIDLERGIAYIANGPALAVRYIASQRILSCAFLET